MMRILSGIRSSGTLHLGNYLGAIKNWIALQEKAETAIYMVADYHAITTPFEPKNFQGQVFDVVLDYLAAGIDPKKSLLIRQSQIPQHTELAWIFNTITPVSWLNRLPTYKEQVEKSPKYNNMGLLGYPDLMAADILIYKANTVPVGDDQLAHIDVTNEIAKKFNHMFTETFEPVKPYLAEGARIMSLKNPENKMSKTGDEAINLNDSADIVKDKLKKATTDSGNEVKFDPKSKPAISNLLNIYHLLSERKMEEIERDYDGKTYVQFKEGLAEVIIEFLRPFQQNRRDIEENEDYAFILKESEQKAREMAQKTLSEVKKKVGVL